MSHDNGNKTEQPTEKHLREAWDEGRFARTPDLQVTFVLAAALGVLATSGHDWCAKIAGITVGILGHLNRPAFTAEAIVEWTKVAATTMLGLALPMAFACAGAAVLAGGLQSRFRVTTKVLSFKLDRLSPAAGFARMFSAQTLTKLGFEIMKLVLVAWAVWGGVRTLLKDPIFAVPVAANRLGSFIEESATMLLGRCLFVLGGVAALSYLYQIRKTRGDLMMTREEVKEENRQNDGDPKLKAAMKQMARRLLQRQMLASVPTADVIITNPTHFAIALKYERNCDKAPMILAKGYGAFAQRIKTLAGEHDVPMVENKPVARMLFKHGKVGQVIPIGLYQAVADILAFVYKTHRYYFHKLKERRAAQ
ncbi:flagellar biosynthesis protein FlhB [Verrucomicrobiota bacterium]|jgi:flagellar biosynthetic protein FlhB|nr:flagellar biosynthesis protein FlhB [Verrucomicrobiota bacterium]